MGPEPSPLLRRTTLPLLLLAAALTEVAAADTRPLALSFGLALLWGGVAAGLGWFVRRPGPGERVPPREVLAAPVVAAAVPFVAGPILLLLTGEGRHPLELRRCSGCATWGWGWRPAQPGRSAFGWPPSSASS